MIQLRKIVFYESDQSNFCVKENFMKKILVTGGTTFVSKYVAEYFVNVGYEVLYLTEILSHKFRV